MENSNSNKQKNQNNIFSKKEEKKEIINKKTKRINKISNIGEDFIDFKNIEFITNPKNVKYSFELTKDSYIYFYLDNSFSIFKSIDDLLILVYANKSRSIVSFNLIENKKINEIRNAHKECISNFRHFLDELNHRDLILSISCFDNSLKLWNINTLECLCAIKNINHDGFLYSACFLKDKNNIFIITSNCLKEFEPIKVYDINGQYIKKINDSNYYVTFIDTFYDNKLSNNYIITGNKDNIKSYDYNENKLYHTYYDNDLNQINNDENNYIFHNSIIINNTTELIKLIESSDDGNIRIWNFYSGELLKKIRINNRGLYGICLWNDEFLFCGCKKSIKLLDIQKDKIIKNLSGHSDYALSIKKIKLHNSECIISQGLFNDQIKLWISQN